MKSKNFSKIRKFIREIIKEENLNEIKFKKFKIDSFELTKSSADETIYSFKTENETEYEISFEDKRFFIRDNEIRNNVKPDDENNFSFFTFVYISFYLKGDDRDNKETYIKTTNKDEFIHVLKYVINFIYKFFNEHKEKTSFIIIPSEQKRENIYIPTIIDNLNDKFIFYGPKIFDKRYPVNQLIAVRKNAEQKI